MSNERTNAPFSASWRQLLKERGWGQNELARRLGVDRSFLSKALREVDSKRLSAEQIARISELAGLPSDFFPEVREARLRAAIADSAELRDRLYDQLSLG